MIATLRTAVEPTGGDASDARRILCVDDERNVLKALKRLLRRERYELYTADSAEAALELLDDVAPAVVISDQRMPGMQGTEFLEIVRKRLPDSVRIVLSGFADAATILESINRGHIYRFLTKPWDDERLRGAIADCVRRYELDLENRRLSARVESQNRQLLEMNRRLEATVEAHAVAIAYAQQIVARLPLPVLGIDPEGRIAQANEASGEGGSPFRGAHIGLAAADVLPDSVGEAVAGCLAGVTGEVEVPVSASDGIVKVRVSRLEVDGSARGCLVTGETEEAR